MNLQSRLDSRLWNTISASYENRDYRNAILDSMHFLSQVIRDKTGLDSDGTGLVGEAFGTGTPLLKVTPMQTESDKNIQRGVEAILRGLYHAVRNPRSHGKEPDSLDTADSIILFTNYLIGIIDVSKSPFEQTSFLERICNDPYFPTRDGAFVVLFLNEIPMGKRLDVAIGMFRSKGQIDAERLKTVGRELLGLLTEHEVTQFCEFVSDELKTTRDEEGIRNTLRMTPPEYWKRYAEASARRIEHILIESMRKGKLNRLSGKCVAGAMGTWADELLPHFWNQGDAISTLSRKILSDDEGEQDYVFNYFFDTMIKLMSEPSGRLRVYLQERLKAGDKRFHEALITPGVFGWSEGWGKHFEALYTNFVEAQPTPATSDGIGDDDVPF
ncbi:MAG: TIGR02391 family protein [Bryobacteraceae bacterium]